MYCLITSLFGSQRWCHTEISGHDDSLVREQEKAEQVLGLLIPSDPGRLGGRGFTPLSCSVTSGMAQRPVVLECPRDKEPKGLIGPVFSQEGHVAH